MDDSQKQPASRLITTLGAVLGQVAKPSSVLKTILTQSVAQTGAERGVFVEVSRSGKLSYRVLYRFQQEDLTGDAGRYSSTIFANVMSGGRTVRLSNALDDPRFAGSGSVHDFSLVSVLCAPIRVDGKIAALVHLEHNKADHFTAHHQELVESLLDFSGPILAALYAGQGVIEQNDELKQSEHRAREELEQDRDQLAKDWSFGRFVGRSAAVRALGRSVGRAARHCSLGVSLGEANTCHEWKHHDPLVKQTAIQPHRGRSRLAQRQARAV